MTLRFVPNTFTLDEQRQEINNLASDVNAIDTTFEERVDDRLSGLLSGGTGISATYNDNTNSLSLSIDFTEFSTDNITEGTNKLFFTESRATQALSGADISVGGLTVSTNNLNSANNIYITTANKEFGFYEGGKITVVDTATPGFGTLTFAHRDPNGEETLAKFTRDGGAELYYDGSKKLETSSTGITVSGSVLIDNALYVNSASPGTGAQILETGAYRARIDDVSSVVQDALVLGRFQNLDSFVVKADGTLTTIGSISADSGINIATNQAYKINNVNVLTATALGSGVTSSSLTSVGTLTTLTVTGAITANGGINLGDNDVVQFGDSNDLQIFHNGENSFIKDTGTGTLNIVASGFSVLNAGANETLANFNPDGSVELYYDNSKKFETTASGITVSGTNINLSTSNTPASATAAGTTGDIRWDTDYIYVCVATNTWKRSAISSWP